MQSPSTEAASRLLLLLHTYQFFFAKTRCLQFTGRGCHHHRAVYFRQKVPYVQNNHHGLYNTASLLSLLLFFSSCVQPQTPDLTFRPTTCEAAKTEAEAAAAAVSQCTATCLGSHRLSAYFLRPESSPFTNTPYTYLHTHNYRGIVHFLLYFFNF